MKMMPDPAVIADFAVSLPHYPRKNCCTPEVFNLNKPAAWPGSFTILGRHNLPKTAASWRKFVEEHRSAQPSGSPDHA